MSSIYNKPKLSTTPSDSHNDKYINQLKVLDRYNIQQPQLRTTSTFTNDLSQFTANNNIQKELINDYERNKKNRYVNIDDEISLFNPNIEYNKLNGTYANTVMRYIDHYINIDSSLRRKEPVITFDGNYKLLNDNCLHFFKESQLMYIKIDKANEIFKVNDKIILEGTTPKVSSYINTNNMTFTNDSNEVIINIEDKNIIDIFPETDNDVYLEINDFTNFDVFANAVEYIGNIPIAIINDTHKFNFTKSNDNLTISFKLPFKYYTSSTYPISTITRTFKISYYFYSNIPIYNINAFYPTSIYAKQPYHTIKSVDENGFYVDVGVKAQNDLDFGNNIRIRKILKYENGYKEPNDYVLELTETYKNIVSVEMISSEFPCTENTIYKNKSIKTSLIQGYNDNNKEITYLQNNKLYWQNQDDGNYIYSIEIDVGKYSMDNLIKEIEKKVYETPRKYYTNDQLYNNRNVIKVNCEMDNDLMIFKSFNEYDFNNIVRCDIKDDELVEIGNGDFMLIELDYDDESKIFIDDKEIEIKTVKDNDILKKYKEQYQTSIYTTYYYAPFIKPSNNFFYTDNVFRLLFNYNDTFGKILGFTDVGNDTSITQYNTTITNKMQYSPLLGFTLDNDDINIGDSINLSGHNYLIMVCEEFPVMDNVLNVNKNQAFQKILLKGIGRYVDGTDYGNYMGGSFVYNSFIRINKIYYTPIHEISRLTFKFYSPTGELYDFNGIDHSFTLKITTLENILDHTNINSHTESTI